jgi:hypothetical protein
MKEGQHTTWFAGSKTFKSMSGRYLLLGTLFLGRPLWLWWGRLVAGELGRSVYEDNA